MSIAALQSVCSDAHFHQLGLAGQKCPERVVVDDFPRTPTGKVRRQELRAALRQTTALGKG
jgi:acyl-CoA synthetase (AMP-forming)/AMP-acid ligase II